MNKVRFLTRVRDVDIEQLVVADGAGAHAATVAAVWINSTLVDGGRRFAVEPVLDGFPEDANSQESQDKHNNSNTGRDQDCFQTKLW